MKSVINHQVAPRTLVLNATRQEPFEIGAQLDALLAFPSEREDDRRRRVADAICASQIAVTIETFPDRARELRHQYARYLQRINRTSLGRLHFRRDRSMLTAHIAITLLKEAMENKPLKLPEGVARRSVPEMARHVVPRKEGEDPSRYEDRLEEFVRRAWRDCQPVAHLSTAYLRMVREFGHREGLVTDYQDVDLHREVVRYAARHAAHLRANRGAPWARTRLVDIEWVE